LIVVLVDTKEISLLKVFSLQVKVILVLSSLIEQPGPNEAGALSEMLPVKVQETVNVDFRLLYFNFLSQLLILFVFPNRHVLSTTLAHARD
jgi:hypothetical protein